MGSDPHSIKGLTPYVLTLIGSLFTLVQGRGVPTPHVGFIFFDKRQRKQNQKKSLPGWGLFYAVRVVSVQWCFSGVRLEPNTVHLRGGCGVFSFEATG